MSNFAFNSKSRYYLATLPGRPDVRHVFRVQDASTHNDTTPVSSECLSCNSNHDLVNVSICQYARAKMSKDFSHYALDCMGPTGIMFIYSEKAPKFCEISTLLLPVCNVDKSKVRFRKILGPTQNIGTLLDNFQDSDFRFRIKSYVKLRPL